MANDLENIHQSGELYSPSQPLAPAPDWGTTELTNREIDEYTQHSAGGQIVFGQTLPAGVTIEQVQNFFGQLAGVFQSDFSILKHNQQHIQKASSWLMNAIANPPQQQRPHHRYNLFEHKNDPVFQAFANYAHDNNFSAKMVQDCCWWVTEAAKRLGESQGKPAQGSAPISSGTDQLSDAEYNALYDYNEKQKPHTEDILRAKWKDSYQANLNMVDAYLQGLSVVEKQHFDRFLNNGLHALNDPTVILGLWGQAIGINNIPRSGPALSDEIAAMENLMRTDRKAWFKDERLNARYRYLLDLRG